ncbi:unnamed protein product [Linum trigynum]|uniref:Chlororespiratory reduction 6 n=1 Tax=Linum trigynum TaxID=586398 RepID=A0AAV2CSX3_9ROSI
MAATIKLVLPPPQQSTPGKQTLHPASPWISCKPISHGGHSSLGITSSPHFTSRPPLSASISFDPSRNFDLTLFDDDQDASDVAPQPMPPSQGRYEVVIDNGIIGSLDLSPFRDAMPAGIIKASDSPASADDAKQLLERSVGFTINYTREDPRDPRELSEFPDVRLWFVRLDAAYPWLPVVLDWRAGELARYAAMMVPHQMNMKMGVVFNPEALELFVMKKVFVVYSWLKEQNVSKARLKTGDMARMLGFGIGNELFDLIDRK